MNSFVFQVVQDILKLAYLLLNRNLYKFLEPVPMIFEGA